MKWHYTSCRLPRVTRLLRTHLLLLSSLQVTRFSTQLRKTVNAIQSNCQRRFQYSVMKQSIIHKIQSCRGILYVELKLFYCPNLSTCILASLDCINTWRFCQTSFYNPLARVVLWFRRGNCLVQTGYLFGSNRLPS